MENKNNWIFIIVGIIIIVIIGQNFGLFSTLPEPLDKDYPTYFETQLLGGYKVRLFDYEIYNHGIHSTTEVFKGGQLIRTLDNILMQEVDPAIRESDFGAFDYRCKAGAAGAVCQVNLEKMLIDRYFDLSIEAENNYIMFEENTLNVVIDSKHDVAVNLNILSYYPAELKTVTVNPGRNEFVYDIPHTLENIYFFNTILLTDRTYPTGRPSPSSAYIKLSNIKTTSYNVILEPTPEEVIIELTMKNTGEQELYNINLLAEGTTPVELYNAFSQLSEISLDPNGQAIFFANLDVSQFNGAIPFQMAIKADYDVEENTYSLYRYTDPLTIHFEDGVIKFYVTY